MPVPLSSWAVTSGKKPSHKTHASHPHETQDNTIHNTICIFTRSHNWDSMLLLRHFWGQHRAVVQLPGVLDKCHSYRSQLTLYWQFISLCLSASPSKDGTVHLLCQHHIPNAWFSCPSFNTVASAFVCVFVRLEQLARTILENNYLEMKS